MQHAVFVVFAFLCDFVIQIPHPAGIPAARSKPAQARR
jgi:hypothetical protein